MATILFPRKGDRLRAHSVFFQALRVAASGIGVLSGMVPSRSSASAIAVASGTYRNGNTGGSYVGGSLTNIPAASSGKHRYDLVVYDVSDTTLKRIAGTEDIPTLSSSFLENSQPTPPELASASQILLGVFLVTSSGISSDTFGHYATSGVANMIIEVPSLPHTQGTDQYLDYGGANQVAVADAKDAVTKRHTQGTDQGLDTGGSYPSTAQQVYNSRIRTIAVIMDNGDYALVAGKIIRIKVDYPCTIQSVELAADQSGSAVVDIWKKAYANLPATVADTITASAKPTLSTALKYQDATLTGWTKTITAGDYLYFKLDSASTITALTISLKVLVG